jgi:hypothetical protein
VENLLMTRENLVGNLLTHIFLSPDPPTIDPNLAVDDAFALPFA